MPEGAAAPTVAAPPVPEAVTVPAEVVAPQVQLQVEPLLATQVLPLLVPDIDAEAAPVATPAEPAPELDIDLDILLAPAEPVEPPPAPALEPAPEAAPAPIALAPEVSTPAEPALIYVVDDSAVVRTKMIKLLKASGYRVEFAKNGQLALDLIAQTRPDVVITDIEMPEIDGYELISRLASADATRDLPVFVISSFEGLSERLAPHANVKGCFGKPWDDALVMTTLAALVGAPSLTDPLPA